MQKPFTERTGTAGGMETDQSRTSRCRRLLSGLRLKLTAEELVKAVTTWAEKQGDIVSVALVGSHARGNASSDSDVDFVIQCTRPARYLEEQTWISEFGLAQSVSIEDWGLVQSVRVFYAD